MLSLIGTRKRIVALVIVAGLFASLILMNAVCFRLDNRKLKNAYGRMVEVDGGQMAVEIYGEGNKETIVILPGFGSPSPILEFKPLAMKLADRYKVITVEPFGYGLSDGTDSERTVENIVEELHSCVNKLGCSNYYLMAHSIGGIYSLYWANRYQEEVQGFIGIDPSVPKQNDVMPYASFLSRLSVRLNQALYCTGITRCLSLINSDGMVADYIDEVHTESEIAALKMLAVDNSAGQEISNEMKNLDKNLDTVRDMIFPADMDVLMLLSSDNCQRESYWEVLHKNVVRETKDCEITQLEGGHYLHLTQAEEISTAVKDHQKQINHPMNSFDQPGGSCQALCQ